MIVVAMSGGVDSSVVAAILKDQGHDVVGVTLQLYSSSSPASKAKSCCASRDIDDAANVARHLGIKHYVFNYEDIFRQEVIDTFIDSYMSGKTPIPCVSCNQTVKFRDLFKVAQDINATSLATGHYVQKVSQNGQNFIAKGTDVTKDQSYFLFQTTQDQVDFLEFPLGGLTKVETRKLAKKYDLPVSDKPESQDICFVAGGNYQDVITKFRPEVVKQGDIVMQSTGEVIGVHSGCFNFTVGQRRGIGVSHASPLFVTKIDPDNNRVFVGTEKYLYKQTFSIIDSNFFHTQNALLNATYKVKLRHSLDTFDARILEINGIEARVELLNPTKAISPGQACVFYEDKIMIGGGFIDKVD